MRIFTPFLCLLRPGSGPRLTQSAGSGTLLDVVLAVKSRPFRIKDSSCIIRIFDPFVHFLFSSRVGSVPFSFINESPPPPLHKWPPSLTCGSVFYPAFVVCLHPLLSIDRYIQQLMRCVNLHNTHTHTQSYRPLHVLREGYSSRAISFTRPFPSVSFYLFFSMFSL